MHKVKDLEHEINYGRIGGRTYAESDTLFKQEISARKFSSPVIEPFEELDPYSEEQRNSERGRVALLVAAV